MSEKPRHNHLTRDIRPFGECPRCDEYLIAHGQEPLNEVQLQAIVEELVGESPDDWPEVS